ncbi:MAG: hypothetical protein Q7R52_02590 [archaeon]|nr:hypothetical protein [archaeon]
MKHISEKKCYIESYEKPEIKKRILFHGTDTKKWLPGKESCYTKNYKTAENYAYLESCEIPKDTGGKFKTPYIFTIKANFINVGGADENVMIGNKYKIIKIKKLKSCKKEGY